MTKTVCGMVIHLTHGLHKSIANGGAGKSEAAFFNALLMASYALVLTDTCLLFFQ